MNTSAVDDYHLFFKLMIQSERYFVDEELTRYPKAEVTNIISILEDNFQNIFEGLNKYNIKPSLARYLLKLVISYTIRNSKKYTESKDLKVKAIHKDLRRQLPWIFAVLKGHNVPESQILSTIETTISVTLDSLSQRSTDYLINEWSDWEDLGDNINSAPAVTATERGKIVLVCIDGNNNLIYRFYYKGQWTVSKTIGANFTGSPSVISDKNVLHILAKDTDNNLWHLKSIDGSSFIKEKISENIQFSPTAVLLSNGIHAFYTGSDNALKYLNFDGSNWTEIESLDGKLTSSPSGVSWDSNRLDIFARSEKDTLIHKYFYQSNWSDWEDLGGNITSSPSASSRAVNRIDVFCRDLNSHLVWIKWNGVEWSKWYNLDGYLTTKPVSVSWGPDRIDVFSRGAANNLIHLYWY